MNLKRLILLLISTLYVSQAYADATVQFECTNAIKISNNNPIIEGVGLAKASQGKPQGFGFSCFKNQKDEIQNAVVPAGSYNIRCVLAHKNIEIPDNIITLHDNKKYYLTFVLDGNGLCTAKISEHDSAGLPLAASNLYIIEILTPDSSIIRDYFIASRPEQHLAKNNVAVELIPKLRSK